MDRPVAWAGLKVLLLIVLLTLDFISSSNHWFFFFYFSKMFDDHIPIHDEFIYCLGAATQVLKFGPWKDLKKTTDDCPPEILFLVIPGGCPRLLFHKSHKSTILGVFWIFQVIVLLRLFANQCQSAPISVCVYIFFVLVWPPLNAYSWADRSDGCIRIANESLDFFCSSGNNNYFFFLPVSDFFNRIFYV